MPKLGIIAGNGRFPFLVLSAAHAHGYEVTIAAIREETDPAIEHAAIQARATLHWLSLGELSRLISTFQRAGVSRAVMAGQVKHKQIFSSIRPDWRLAKVLLSLTTRNTDSLIGAVAKVLEDEDIHLISSTELLTPLLAKPGVLTARAPSESELRDIAYGRQVARALTAYDIGQTVVVAAQAVVALEAMEGTDATIRRAGEIMASLKSPAADHAAQSTLSRALTVVKAAKPNQDMRFDVPVVGLATLECMRTAGATCLALDAEKCLLIDGPDHIRAAADRAHISISAE
jgi:DUF1009 family protein